MTHRSTIRVRFAELDPYGHVNHAVYVTYCEVARVEALEAAGIDLHQLQRDGWQLVVTEVAARYRRAAVGGDTLEVTSTIGEIGGASARWRQVISRGGEVVVDADIRTALTDLTGRPRRLTPELRTQLARLATCPPDDMTAATR